MNAAFATFGAMHTDLIAAMGEPATVQRGDTSIEVLLFVEDNVVDVGQYGQVVAGKRVVSAIKADWEFVRGDFVTVRDGTTRKVDAILADDGIVITAVLVFPSPLTIKAALHG